MKKIVHVTTSLKQGGAESVLVDLITALPDYAHSVITFYDGFNTKRLEKKGIHVWRVPYLFFRYDFYFLWTLFITLYRAKPDVIHTTLWSANCIVRIYAWILGIPCVCAIHQPVNRDGYIRNVIDSHTYNLAQHVIVVSENIHQSVLEKKYIPVTKLNLVHNGIEVNRLQSEAQRVRVQRAALGIAEDALVIGTVGRFVPIKNYGHLLEIFAAVVKKEPRAVLMLVGYGPEEMQLKIQAERLGIADAVFFVVGKAAVGYYPLFDIFVMTSIEEGMPIALLEAMSFALPCVITKNSLVDEVIVQGKNGFLIGVHATQAFIEKLLFLIRNPSVRNEVGAQAFRHVSTHFTTEKMAQKYETIFKEAMQLRSYYNPGAPQ